MGGGEILKKGWLIKSPPLEGSGLKVSYVVCEHSECGVRWLWCKFSQTCLNKSINQIMLVPMFTVLLKKLRTCSCTCIKLGVDTHEARNVHLEFSAHSFTLSSLQQLLQICGVDTSETSLVKTEEKSL